MFQKLYPNDKITVTQLFMYFANNFLLLYLTFTVCLRVYYEKDFVSDFTYASAV